MSWLTAVSSVVLLLQVASMRWNVVIGGQLFSKSFRGFTDHLEFRLQEVLLEYYSPTSKLLNYLGIGLFGLERMIIPVIVFGLCFVAIAVFCKILPPFEKAEDAID